MADILPCSGPFSQRVWNPDPRRRFGLARRPIASSPNRAARSRPRLAAGVDRRRRRASSKRAARSAWRTSTPNPSSRTPAARSTCGSTAAPPRSTARRCRPARQGGRPGDRREVAVANLERDRAGTDAGGAQPAATESAIRTSSRPTSSRSKRSYANVSSWPIDLTARSLSTGRSSRRRRDLAGAGLGPAEAATGAPRCRGRRGRRRGDADPAKPLQGRRAYTPQPLDRERVQERPLVAGRDHDDPATGLDALGVARGLASTEASLARNLLAPRRPSSRPSYVADVVPEPAGDRPAVAEHRAGAGDVEERLVEGQRLDERRERRSTSCT